MRLGRLCGIPIRLHPLALPMMALAVWMGEGGRLAVMMGSILLHELTHMAAARALHVRVLELTLMPIGGAARLENLWGLRPGQVSLVAMAGPACNLIIVMAAAALCRWRLLGEEWTAVIIEQNLIIFLFNLIPALPMDGGRILCGLMGRRMSPAASARAGSMITCGIAGGMLVLSVYGVIRRRLNITLPLAALFLLMSAGKERRQSESAAIESLAGRAAEMEEEGVLPVRWLAVGEGTHAREAAARLRPRVMHMLAVFDRGMRLIDVVSEEALISALMENGERKMGELGRNVKKKVF